jgi:anti-sigma B factor antagonist
VIVAAGTDKNVLRALVDGTVVAVEHAASDVTAGLEPPVSVPFSIELDRASSHAVVTVAGEVDIASSPRLRDAGLEAFGIEPTHVVMDLTGVTFIDSTGLSVLVLMRRRARTHRSRLSLIGNAKVEALLRIAGLRMVFEVVPDLATALDDVDATA